ncbi:MAG: type IX secretion system plug protein [Luteibaculaceae bacterium]
MRSQTLQVSLILCLACFLNTLGSSKVFAFDYYTDQGTRFIDYTYKPNIRTVLFTTPNTQIGKPTIALNSRENLELRFDDFDLEIKFYYYTLIHCDANWRPSDLMQAEYISGFFEDFINNNEFSFNLFRQYNHYRLSIPNNNMRIKLSGNYLLKVYEEGKPDDPIITRRFSVFENRVNVTPSIRRSNIPDGRSFKQQLNFTVNYAALGESNAFNDLKVVVQQNDRWDNAKFNPKHSFMDSQLLTFDIDAEMSFQGGNEFRPLDLRSIRFETARMLKMDDTGDDPVATMETDVPRNNQRYSTLQDLNGAFFITSLDNEVTNPHLDGNYAFVRFSLAVSEPTVKGSFYMFGQLTDYSYRDEFRFKYNAERRRHEVNLFLKQGFYDYAIAYVEDGSNVAELDVIEGSHFETENNYTIYVYYTDRRLNYDRLVAVRVFNTIDRQ